MNNDELNKAAEDEIYERLDALRGEYLDDDELRYEAKFILGIGKKAGAKWAMEQGVIANVSIDEFSCGLYNLCVQCGLTSEDGVIVQIRKKDE